MVTREQRAAIIEAAGENIEKDPYYFTNVCSVYYDTPSMQLIRSSLDKPEYKEKIRLRSYGVPNYDSKVFLEIKKKYEGIVYKRRTSMRYIDAQAFIAGIRQPRTQIERELAWSLSFYKDLEPSVYVCYDRTSFVGTKDRTFRLTFDTNVTYRREDLTLADGNYGDKLVNYGTYIMEVKSPYSIPLWLAKVLDELEIRPTSYSKYGEIYRLSLDESKRTAAADLGEIPERRRAYAFAG